MKSLLPFFCGALGLAALAALVQLRYPPPPPRPADAPADVFSAARAAALHRAVIGDRPHPAGSAANAAVRARLVRALEELGYEVEVQGFKVRGRAMANVIASRPGAVSGPAVALACHYDSVAAGPGAGDDGAAVAALLELARIAAGAGPRREGRALVLLFTDGEEGGLFGARAFINGHPRAESIGVIANFEARGAAGPSMMFETSAGNRALIARYAEGCARPVAGSLFYEVYKRLPNDTDFTIFKAAGLPGYNFAFIGRADRYHTAEDRLENLDLGSLQHHGDNALSLLRSLDRAEGLPELGEDAVYFDVLALGLVSWPASWSLPAHGALALLAVSLAWARRGQLRAGALLRGLPWWPGAIVTSAALAYGASQAFPAVRSAAQAWPEEPPLSLALFYALGFSGLGLTAIPALARGGFWGLWSAVWLWWFLASLALACFLPTACYLLLLPCAAAALAGIGGAIAPSTRRARLLAVAGPAMIVALLWLPLERLFYDAFGLAGAAFVAPRAALILSPLLPLLAAGALSPKLSGDKDEGFVA